MRMHEEGLHIHAVCEATSLGPVKGGRGDVLLPYVVMAEMTIAFEMGGLYFSGRLLFVGFAGHNVTLAVAMG